MADFNPAPFQLQQVDYSGLARGIERGLGGLAQGLAEKRRKEELAAKELEETKKMEKMMEKVGKAYESAYDNEGYFDPEVFSKKAAKVPGMDPNILRGFLNQGTQTNYSNNQRDQLQASQQEQMLRQQAMQAEQQQQQAEQAREKRIELMAGRLAANRPDAYDVEGASEDEKYQAWMKGTEMYQKIYGKESPDADPYQSLTGPAKEIISVGRAQGLDMDGSPENFQKAREVWESLQKRKTSSEKELELIKQSMEEGKTKLAISLWNNNFGDSAYIGEGDEETLRELLGGSLGTTGREVPEETLEDLESRIREGFGY